MRLIDTVRLSAKSLMQHRVRAALTTLGIVIGVAAVIAMMEIGWGSSRAIEQTIQSMGSNNLLVMPGTAASSGVSFGAGTSLTLTPEDAAAMTAECPAVAYAAPVVRAARPQVIRADRNWVPPYVYGSTPDYLSVRDWEPPAAGAMFTDLDVRNANRVCLLGKTIARELFGTLDPIGEEIRIQNVVCRVIGLLRQKGANLMGMDQDDVILAPWTMVKYRVWAAMSTGGQTSSGIASRQLSVTSSSSSSSAKSLSGNLNVRFETVDQIAVKARAADQIEAATQQITSLLRQRHRLRPDEPDDFSIRNMSEMAQALSSTTRVMRNLLLTVALISLVVGGVGIMNIMLVSVSERTREIGIRMAVGARPGDIQAQFLSEAILLCLAGGVLGILLGRGGSLLVRYVLTWPTETSLPAIIWALAVSGAVGLIFGFYPAWKASQLDPITALRYE